MSPTRRGLAWLSHRCDGLIRTDWAQCGYYCGSDIVSSVGWLGVVARRECPICVHHRREPFHGDGAEIASTWFFNRQRDYGNH